MLPMLPHLGEPLSSRRGRGPGLKKRKEKDELINSFRYFEATLADDCSAPSQHHTEACANELLRLRRDDSSSNVDRVGRGATGSLVVRICQNRALTTFTEWVMREARAPAEWRWVARSAKEVQFTAWLCQSRGSDRRALGEKACRGRSRAAVTLLWREMQHRPAPALQRASTQPLVLQHAGPPPSLPSGPEQPSTPSLVLLPPRTERPSTPPPSRPPPPSLPPRLQRTGDVTGGMDGQEQGMMQMVADLGFQQLQDCLEEFEEVMARAELRALVEAPCKPLDCGRWRFWAVGGLIIAEVHMTMSDSNRECRCVVFVLELFKTEQGSSHGCGRFGPAAMGQLQAEVQQRLECEVDEWQLLVRVYQSEVEAQRAEQELMSAEAAQRAGDRATEAWHREAAVACEWEHTRPAREMYKQMGYRQARRTDTMVEEGYDPVCQQYLVASGTDVAAAVAAAGGVEWATWVTLGDVCLAEPQGGLHGHLASSSHSSLEAQVVCAMYCEHLRGDKMMQLDCLKPGGHAEFSFYLIAMARQRGESSAITHGDKSGDECGADSTGEAELGSDWLPTQYGADSTGEAELGSDWLPTQYRRLVAPCPLAPSPKPALCDGTIAMRPSQGSAWCGPLSVAIQMLQSPQFENSHSLIKVLTHLQSIATIGARLQCSQPSWWCVIGDGHASQQAALVCMEHRPCVAVACRERLRHGPERGGKGVGIPYINSGLTLPSDIIDGLLAAIKFFARHRADPGRGEGHSAWAAGSHRMAGRRGNPTAKGIGPYSPSDPALLLNQQWLAAECEAEDAYDAWLQKMDEELCRVCPTAWTEMNSPRDHTHNYACSSGSSRLNLWKAPQTTASVAIGYPAFGSHADPNAGFLSPYTCLWPEELQPTGIAVMQFMNALAYARFSHGQTFWFDPDCLHAFRPHEDLLTQTYADYEQCGEAKANKLWRQAKDSAKAAARSRLTSQHPALLFDAVELQLQVDLTCGPLPTAGLVQERCLSQMPTQRADLEDQPAIWRAAARANRTGGKSHSKSPAKPRSERVQKAPVPVSDRVMTRSSAPPVPVSDRAMTRSSAP